MPTTQYCVMKSATGQAPTIGTLRMQAFAINGDTVLYTSDATIGVAERTNAKTQYVGAFVETVPVPAGDYFIIMSVVSGGRIVATGERTFAGTDGETAITRPAVLDSATQAQIDAIEASTVGMTGTGARTVTITIDDGTTPLQNAKVRMAEGVNTFTATTDVSGGVVFNLDDATYTVSVTKSGYTYAGTTLVVDGTEAVTYSMTLVAITPPANPGLSALVVLCLDEDGEPEAGVDIDIRIVTVPSGDQNIAYKGSKQTATSDVDGIARLEAVQGSVCEWKRGRSDVWARVTIDGDSSTNVTSIIGSP